MAQALILKESTAGARVAAIRKHFGEANGLVLTATEEVPPQLIRLPKMTGVAMLRVLKALDRIGKRRWGKRLNVKIPKPTLTKFTGLGGLLVAKSRAAIEKQLKQRGILGDEQTFLTLVWFKERFRPGAKRIRVALNAGAKPNQVLVKFWDLVHSFGVFTDLDTRTGPKLAKEWRIPLLPPRPAKAAKKPIPETIAPLDPGIPGVPLSPEPAVEVQPEGFGSAGLLLLAVAAWFFFKDR